jgi:hypothetical protein
MREIETGLTGNSLTPEGIEKPHNTMLSIKTINSLQRVDAMPKGLRECVHEFGLPIVEILTKFGIKNPAHIREVVMMIWQGPRAGAGRQGASALNTVDWVLSRSVGEVSIKGLLRTLHDGNLCIAPRDPTAAMIDASMNEVSSYNVVCTKREKHRRRLSAALRVAMEEQMK